jgi:hypothetical protein
MQGKERLEKKETRIACCERRKKKRSKEKKRCCPRKENKKSIASSQAHWYREKHKVTPRSSERIRNEINQERKPAGTSMVITWE